MTLFRFLVFLTISAITTSAPAQTTLVLDSWRDDDRVVWEDTIIPAFEAVHPDIRIEFRASAPTDYDSVLRTRLEAGTAGDLITCRPFDASVALYEAGYLADLDSLAGMKHFSDVAKSAWQTDSGATTFCVPVASVIHGFLYNQTTFHRLALEIPKTEAMFFAILEKLLIDETLVPMAMGLQDRWEAATLGYNNIGPTYWQGEEGRRQLIKGQQKLTDESWIAPFRTLSRWERYLGKDFRTRSYRDSQDLFVGGGAAIYPAGSWEISGFKARARFNIGAFPPPVNEAGDTCYISDHMDMGIGLNTASQNGVAARKFLNWVTSAQFASLYANALPGFLPLAEHLVEIDDPLARTFLSWREQCQSTIRFASQYFLRGRLNLEQEIWDASVAAIAGTAKAEELGARLQNALAD